jgi:hypothetical protein
MNGYVCPPSNRKLENQARHKQMLVALAKFQEKLDDLAGNDLMKDEAYVQLCNQNKELYDKFKTMFDEIVYMKNLYHETIINNPWVVQYTQGDYHRDQQRTREYKINHPDYQLCPCGDWISKFRINGTGIRRINPKSMIDHQKREKCMSNRARIKWKTLDKMSLHNVISFDKYLLMNSHMNRMCHNEQPKLIYKDKLSMLVRRRRINQLG